MSQPKYVDVLLVGGGPTSLLVSYLLVCSHHKVLAVEQYDKYEQGLYGRACLLYAGTLELLDLVGLYDRVADIGFPLREAVTYKDGVQSSSRGWMFIQEVLAKSDTMFKFSFSLRQKHWEDVLRQLVQEMDPSVVHAPAKLVTYRTVDSAEYPIVATVEFPGGTEEVHCKYLIGADGGRSTVRKVGNFPFPGTASPYKWVRMDAIVKTNMPLSHTHAISIESKIYGNVLWTLADNGRVRIGFLYNEPPGTQVTEDLIKDRAKKAVHPFDLEFVLLEWWTIYEIGQRIADTFRQGSVFLAGDAAHTHSSGAAQGMNTGFHDSVNLGWKLSGVLSGIYSDSVLDTYNSERRTSAERLINLDKDIAALISGNIPDHFNAPPDADPNDYLADLYDTNAEFTTGLGISYEYNSVNWAPTSPVSKVEIGHRAPDGPVFRPGRAFAQPLRTLVRYTGSFWVLVFAGKLEAERGTPAHLNQQCTANYHALRATIDSEPSIFNSQPTCWNFLTIFSGRDLVPASQALGAQPLGQAAYDYSGEVFKTYGVDQDVGAVVVLRPDGIVSFVTAMDGAGGEGLDEYFRSIAGARVHGSAAPVAQASISKGYEVDVEGEDPVQVLV
ncbi:FAD binding domain-containing protein [Roridomyces roridus]|uniref:FAD binding domain-containing protein n=1 Tax=Roridomyces roridus TaxID=1738132 RepID=A0AAD7BK98_9AGAR|nr:FAD binding domain-containing protein [Roridomyces roridus]